MKPRFVLIDVKQVRDADGFYTEYAWYMDKKYLSYVFVFGDTDLYEPEDGWFDCEIQNYDEALEWFENYNGFDEE